MRVIGRLLVVLAVAFPVAVAFAGGADGATPAAIGPAAQHCDHWDGGLQLAPGVGNSPANQTVSAHGRLFGCTKGGGGAQFAGTFQMSQATCGDLEMTGMASFDWVNGSHSTAFLLFHYQALEPNKVFIDGSMTSGMFQTFAVRSWLRFTRVFQGSGAQCSPTNLLRRIDFTNSQSFQLLTPVVTTTTQPPPTTRPHPTTPTTPYTPRPTVPITNGGGPLPTVPITYAFQGGPPPAGGGGGGFVAQQFPQGTLAFTGSSSGLAAMFGFETLLVGGALACLNPERRRRRMARFAYVAHRPKSFLQVTLPPMR